MLYTIKVFCTWRNNHMCALYTKQFHGAGGAKWVLAYNIIEAYAKSTKKPYLFQVHISEKLSNIRVTTNATEFYSTKRSQIHGSSFIIMSSNYYVFHTCYRDSIKFYVGWRMSNTTPFLIRAWDQRCISKI